MALESQGYQLLEASNGAEALQVAAAFEGSIDLLVTDVVMPEIGGRQLVEALRGQRPDIRVLYISGYTSDAVIHAAAEAGDGFLSKPFSPTALARKVRSLLDHGEP